MRCTNPSTESHKMNYEKLDLIRIETEARRLRAQSLPGVFAGAKAAVAQAVANLLASGKSA